MSNVLQELYDSEINFSITTFWDGGLEVKVGDEFNGFTANNTFDTFQECVDWLAVTAAEKHPTSGYVFKPLSKNMSRRTWYFVYTPDNGSSYDWAIMADDPIRGEFVGFVHNEASAEMYCNRHNKKEVASWCCYINPVTERACMEDATFSLIYGSSPDDYTHSCDYHVGHLYPGETSLGVPIDNMSVVPIEESDV